MKSPLPFTLSVLSMSILVATSAAQAGMLVREDFDFSTSRPSPLIIASDRSPMTLQGTLQKDSDPQDVIRFAASRRMKQIQLRIQSTAQTTLRYELYEDTNRNGRADAGERRIPGQGTSLRVPASKHYIMRIFRSNLGATQNINYTIQMNAQ